MRLYRDLSSGLLQYALTITQDRGLAEDSLQECFLRYFLVRRQGAIIRSERAWLCRVLRNLLVDARRREGNFLAGSAAEGPDAGRGPEWEAERAEFLRLLGPRLTSREWECLRLRLEGLRYREIAELLNIRIGTVGAILARALKKAQKSADTGGGGTC